MQNLKQLLARPAQPASTDAAPAMNAKASQDDLVSALVDIKRLHAVRAQHAQLLSNYEGASSRREETETQLGQFTAAKHPNTVYYQKKLESEQVKELHARIALAELEASSDWKTLCFLIALKTLLKDL